MYTLCTQLLNRNLTGTGYWISLGYQLNELLVGQGEGHHFPAFPSMQFIKLTWLRDKDLEQFLPGFDFALNILLKLKGQCIHKNQVKISSYIAHYCTFLSVLKSREQSLLLSDTLPSSGKIQNCHS